MNDDEQIKDRIKCNMLSASNSGEDVCLMGWVMALRDKHKIIWIDIVDQYGKTQLVIDDHATLHLFEEARKLQIGDVIHVKGKVAMRQNPNLKIKTGKIELIVAEIRLINKTLPLPLNYKDNHNSEEVTMRYRYLDLRRSTMRNNLLLRHMLVRSVRQYLEEKSFIEVETPMLIRSTPEGAREFKVFSHRYPNHYYVLPQSPQIYKQLLMVAGIDRYYQIARCFRDEDLRSDRQAEFTQIDCELSFAKVGDICCIFGGLLHHLFEKVRGKKLPPIKEINYHTAMEKYGSDAPDLRWEMTYQDWPQTLVDSSLFSPFRRASISIKGICVKNGKFLFSKIKKWKKEGEQYGISGITSLKKEQKYLGDLTKIYKTKQLTLLWNKMGAKNDDLIIWIWGLLPDLYDGLHFIRQKITEKIAPTFPDMATWVVDFPLLKWDSIQKKFTACHHPFTSPKEEHKKWLKTDPEKVLSNAYDLVINGVEIGGGSIRNHLWQDQMDVFNCLGMNAKESQQEFGTLLEALQYGAPPHGGIALGLDRLCLLLGGGESIRDYIAFPKNNAIKDSMMGLPMPLSPAKN